MLIGTLIVHVYTGIVCVHYKGSLLYSTVGTLLGAGGGRLGTMYMYFKGRDVLTSTNQIRSLL